MPSVRLLASHLFLTLTAPSNESSVQSWFLNVEDRAQSRRLITLDPIQRCSSTMKLPLAHGWHIQVC